MKTHYFHNLTKPFLFAILLLVFLIALLAFLHWHIDLKLPLIQKDETEPQTIEQYYNGAWRTITIQQRTYTHIVILMLPLAGFYTLIGVGLFEAVYRFLKRNASLPARKRHA